MTWFLMVIQILYNGIAYENPWVVIGLMGGHVFIMFHVGVLHVVRPMSGIMDFILLFGSLFSKFKYLPKIHTHKVLSTRL